MKNFMIFGDSYSTHKNHIPEGYVYYYADEGRDEGRGEQKMLAEQTWWWQLKERTGANLVHNNSWSGSTIGYTGYSGDCSKTSSFICRYEKLFDGLYALTDEEAVKKQFGGGMTLYYFKEMGQHQTAEALQACQKPMLIMQGEKDVQVSVEHDFALYKKLLSDREDVQFRLYERLSHAFVPAIYGTIDKAAKEFKVEQHIGDAVLDDIADFIWRT